MTTAPSILAQQALKDIWFTKANSTQAAETDFLFVFILWISIVSFVLLMGAMFYFVFRYRRRPGVPTIRSASHNTALELGWSIGPLLILVPVFFLGLKGYIAKQAAPANVEIINVRGSQWNWSIQYSNGGSPRDTSASPSGDQVVPIIIVPATRPVKLILTSSDVIHAFFIPDFRVKIDVIPNRYTSMWFMPLGDTSIERDASGKPLLDKNGKIVYHDHHVFCAEYCGDNHSDMTAYIRVVPDEEFDRLKAEYAEPKGSPAEIGKQIYQQFCSSCHTIDGSPKTGPSWKNLWGKTEQFSDGSSADLSNYEAFLNYVRESIYSPQAKLVKGGRGRGGGGGGGGAGGWIIKEKYILDIAAFIMSKEVSPDGPPSPLDAPVNAPAPAEGAAAPMSGDAPVPPTAPLSPAQVPPVH